MVFHDNFRLEVVSDVISSLVVEHDGMDVCVKFGDSMLNRLQDIRAAPYVVDNVGQWRTDRVNSAL